MRTVGHLKGNIPQMAHDLLLQSSDVWIFKENILFNKAFRAHKKNFYLIHKMVQTKTVAQCVEYYYTWKKRIRFTTSSQAPGLKKRVKRKLFESDPTETKGV
ncbi:Zinc finger protein 541 [Manis javanica]|nr:Zinc finger protein 541 [Manis javanica]